VPAGSQEETERRARSVGLLAIAQTPFSAPCRLPGDDYLALSFGTEMQMSDVCSAMSAIYARSAVTGALAAAQVVSEKCDRTGSRTGGRRLAHVTPR
jgi:hypothetical protein